LFGTNSPLYSHQPRNYIEATENEIADKSLHINLLKTALRKRGIKTY